MIEWLAGLDPRALIIGMTLLGALLGFPLLVAAIDRLSRLKLVRSAFFFIAAGLVFAAVTLSGLIAANLFTYARLTHEQEAARVSIRQLGERHFAVSVQRSDAPAARYDLRGDEWQIDARVLKWRAAGNLLGLDTLYRLERISGRYGDIDQERGAPRTVHAISRDPGLDLWILMRRFERYVPLADAQYGSGAYVPLAPGAEYVVTVSASGLVVRPANDAARKAVGGWK